MVSSSVPVEQTSYRGLCFAIPLPLGEHVRAPGIEYHDDLSLPGSCSKIILWHGQYIGTSVPMGQDSCFLSNEFGNIYLTATYSK